MAVFGKGSRHTEEARAKMRAAVKRKRDPRERFWEKVDKTPGLGSRGECWLWKHPNPHLGYGYFLLNGKSIPAHVASYFFHYGKMPPAGLDVDHLCRVRACVNPAHLEAVPHRVNSIRGECGWKTGAKMRARTHCKNGHEFTPENTNLVRKGRSIKRRCRACGRAITARCAAKKRALQQRKESQETHADGNRTADSGTFQFTTPAADVRAIHV